MKVVAVGKGRRTIDKGLGRLTLSKAVRHETKHLLVLLEELQAGNFGLWTLLMWASQNDKLTKAEIKTLDGIVDRLGKEYSAFTTETK